MKRERRKYPRADIRANATITVGGRDISVVTRNISRCGMLLAASDPIDEFTVIALSLELPYLNDTVSVNCEGVIVRVQMGFEPDYPYSLAVHFVELEEATGDRISAYVDDALSGIT
ncbi:MAG: PilZ domain-containing protein [bacterium]|nr:PilZ domain-containing protein [bacterium]